MISKEEAKSKIKRLIDLYEKYQSTGQIDNFRGKEDNTKSTFIEPFFEALGWDVKNQESIEMLKEEPILKGAVDYAFLIEGQYKFFVEAKPIGRDLKNVKSLKEAAEQSIRYGVNSNNKYVVLTNFEWLVIFNCELKGQLWEKWLFEPMSYKDYLANFKQIWLLSKEGALKNELDVRAGSIGKRVPRTPVDKELLQKFLKWREKLSKDLKKYPEEEIDEFVQKLLVRLLFIRNCEDRGFETVHTLWSASQFYQIHKRGLLKFLRGIFKYYDVYNGSIFKESEIDSIEFNEALLAEIINGLYVSEDEVKYDFNIIPADVMGRLYEQYLGHILKKTPQTAKLKEGKTHRKEQGIYYTPTYIVDYIVRNTLGELLKNKRVDASKIRVLDPACGSGSFLVKSFDVLNEHYAKDKMYGQKTLTGYSTKERILKNNIFGVDLDKQAAEIAQLNLLLRIAEKGQKLPLLQQNVKIGNSLIDDEKVAGDKAFKWEEQFKDIIQNGGFDVVVGNPPYVRIQTLDKEEVDYYNKKYKSPTKNYDIYILFIEKGLSLLKEDGLLGLILPHKFFQGEMGENIRKYIHETKSLYKLVDFTTNQVFEDAATYTCLLFLSKRKNKQFLYKRFKLGDNFKDLQMIEFERKDTAILKEDKWNFSDDAVQKVLSKIFSQKNSFPDITKKIFKGSSTGDDEIFLLDPIEEDKNTFTVFSKRLNQNVKIEKVLLRPFVYGEDIRRYAPLRSKKLLLFPYNFRGNEVELIPVEQMKKYYPLAYEYLSKLKGDLIKRKIATNNSNFYKYSAARSLVEYNQPKIMIPDMLISNRISYDERGIIFHGPAIHSIVFNERIKGQNPIFYLAILNSKLFWFFISNTSTALRGNAYRLTPEFLNPFCFPKLDLTKSSDKQSYDKLVSLADKMLSLNKRLNELGDKLTDERAKIEEEIKKTDAEIDELVYKIYGITEEEKKIIEESLK